VSDVSRLQAGAPLTGGAVATRRSRFIFERNQMASCLFNVGRSEIFVRRHRFFWAIMSDSFRVPPS
jgi:hypothetical protein